MPSPKIISMALSEALADLEYAIKNPQAPRSQNILEFLTEVGMEKQKSNRSPEPFDVYTQFPWGAI